MTPHLYDVLILGGGPSGLTAAIYTARANLRTLVIAGNPPGGQLMLTTEVENFPGFPQGIIGPDFINNCMVQAKRFGTELVEEDAIKLEGSVQEKFSVQTDAGNVYEGKSVIIATGASAKWLELENEQKLRGKGVSACATCDGFFFKDKVVAVVGGGDAAMEESTFLTKFCPKVYVLVRSSQEEMKASKIMQQEAIKNSRIEFKFNTEVVDVLGSDFVSGLRVKNTVTNDVYDMNDIQGLFLAIGHKPNTSFLEGFIELEKFGYVKVTNHTHTSIEGVFAAGDVSDPRYRQAVTAAGLGCMAALDVEKYLTHGPTAHR